MKIEKIKPTAKILKDTLNITVVFPSETQIDNYVEKVCSALMDTKKKGDNIKKASGNQMAAYFWWNEGQL